MAISAVHIPAVTIPAFPLTRILGLIVEKSARGNPGDFQTIADRIIARWKQNRANGYKMLWTKPHSRQNPWTKLAWRTTSGWYGERRLGRLRARSHASPRVSRPSNIESRR